MPKNTLDNHLIVEPDDILGTIKKLKYWSIFLFTIYGVLNVSIVYYFESPQTLKGFFEYRETEMWFLELFIYACLPTWTFYLSFLFVKLGVVPKELDPLSERKEYPRKSLSDRLSFFFITLLLIPFACFILGSIISMFLDFILSIFSELIFDQYISFKDNDLIMESSTKILILMWLAWINYLSSKDEIEST